MIASTSSAHDEQHATKETTEIPDQDLKKDDSTTNQPNISTPKSQLDTDPHTDSPPKKDISNNDPASDPAQVRMHLENLIKKELEFIDTICPKLGKHQQHIKKEANDARTVYQNLKAGASQLKELKDLKKTVTKLKLQIPAKYRTYDFRNQQKDQQSDADNKGIPAKLQKIMPRLHNKLFHESPFCKTIQQRYDELKRELKLCLLCFSVFPENALISRRILMYWWIGEGFVPLEDDLIGGRTQEDYANDFFKELMDKDFIEPVSKWHGRNVAICRMHPMVRAAIIMIADKVNFFDFDEYGNPKDFGKFDEIESPDEIPINYPLGDPREFFDFYDEDCNETEEPIEFFDSNGNATPFAVYDPKNKDLHHVVDRDGKKIDTSKKFYFYRRKNIITRSYKVCLMGSGLSKGITWEKLHVLFNVRDDILEFKPEWFIRMKNANMVFLGRWQSSAAHHIEVEEFDFEKSLDHMNHVRFFSLQGVSRISSLPTSISKLESLLILDLRACHNLEAIPKTIGSFKLLTHLDMSECYLLQEMPKEISCLESLQVLKGFVVVDSPGKHVCTLHDLINLEHLRKLSMYTHMKDFPQESHLDALQKFDMLRKLTILWGGHESNINSESKPELEQPKIDVQPNINSESKLELEQPKIDVQPKQKLDVQPKQKLTLASRLTKLISKKQWVKGSLRRMNAFNNSTLGSRLEKLDLKCFPQSSTPNWLTPDSLKGLKKLYIRGGKFSDLGQYQHVLEWDDSPIPPKDTWNVEVLRLKYLDEIKMDWMELKDLFPKMTSLEKVKCPRLTLFPCNERGLWTKKTSSTT